MRRRSEVGAPLNVVYLKTSEPDFYLFSNVADLGFEPYAEVLAQDACCTLVVTGKFKLKRTRKRLRNRLDIYMTAESGKALGMDIYRAYGRGTPRKSKGDPDSTWNGETRVPSVLSKYFTNCRGLVASAGGGGASRAGMPTKKRASTLIWRSQGRSILSCPAARCISRSFWTAMEPLQQSPRLSERCRKRRSR